jgi:hypothetical protein
VVSGDCAFTALVRAIAAGDAAAAGALLARSPELATARAEHGATRQDAAAHFLAEIGQYVYAGHTALHVAAAGHRHALAEELIRRGADVSARNRRGAEPLHYAADGRPGAPGWDPRAQAATIACLIAAGADPNARDKSRVAPLHRAVRTRSAAAVRALLDGGADPELANGRGSTPLRLATLSTGRGGSGSAEAKAEQAQIVRALTAA